MVGFNKMKTRENSKSSPGYKALDGVRVFNASFNYISVISWQSVLLMEETRVPGENH